MKFLADYNRERALYDFKYEKNKNNLIPDPFNNEFKKELQPGFPVLKTMKEWSMIQENKICTPNPNYITYP